MKRVILTCVEDNVTGELGLIVDGLKQLSNEFMATTEGLIIAHDLIEHQNGIKAIGSIDDELEALGACWWIRGQWGLLREGSYNSPEEGLARDVGHLGEIFCRGVEFRTYVPRTRPGEWNETRSEEHTSELQSPDHLVCRLLLEKKKNQNERM